jgi:hypothetical protein
VSGEIVAVLVVPAAGDPGGLLAAGPCGGVPPRVLSGHTCAYGSHQEWQTPDDLDGRDCYMCRHPLFALPLWWDGALVPEGWDRARRVYLTACRGNPRAVHYGTAEVRDPDLYELVGVADELVHADLASRVVRLARVDGRLVEVTP